MKKHIDPEKVKKAVYNRIDFELPEEIWHEIDRAFGHYWNDVIGFSGEIDTYGTVNFIAAHLKKQHILFQFKKIVSIVDIIWDYLEMTKGFLGDDVIFIPPVKKSHSSTTLSEEEKRAIELTALIDKASEAGKKEVEEMMKHPLSAKELEEFVKMTQKSEENFQRLRDMNLL